jgi:hypothetical protein
VKLTKREERFITAASVAGIIFICLLVGLALVSL